MGSILSKEAIVTSEKKAKWIYWVLTAPFGLMVGAGGLALLAGAAPNVEGITHLGYPVYLCKILGTAKLLDVIAILYGRLETLKEWAYAGITFNLLGASASHAFSGDGFGKVIVPVIMLGFVLTSYRLWKNPGAKLSA